MEVFVSQVKWCVSIVVSFMSWWSVFVVVFVDLCAVKLVSDIGIIVLEQLQNEESNNGSNEITGWET